MASAEANPAKRKLTLLSDSDSDSDSDDGGASLQVNEEYARRFEHNKKREEKQRLEEKYKNQQDDSEDDESSSDETEDEAGFLATEALDAKMTGMLNALRSKDPSVYDKSKKFFTEEDLEQAEQQKDQKKEKPVTLQDYHRKNFMEGYTGAEDDKDTPMTYAQEQDAMKKSIVDAMHADESDEESDSDDGFGMKRKEPAKADSNGVHASRSDAIKKKPELDVEHADRDPDTFLSNFMASRAWVPEEGGKWEAFESDDGEGENEMADDWEQAYNMRFEDPAKSNEVLKSYSRDLANSRSVRRDDKSGRKRRRDAEKEKKEAEKAERREEKARLKKLRIDDAEQKLQKFRQAAGAVGEELNEEDWVKFLDDAYDNDKWEEEMNKRFGDDYYAVEDEGLEDEEGNDGKKRLKKPKWDDDIDINDIIPDFDDGKGQAAGDEEEEAEDEDEDAPPSKKRKSADHKRARLDTQKKARADHAKVEALIDSKLNLDHHPLLSSSSGFKYRETEPQSFGMTARDILLAPSDSALNDYAGLKKLAHWRDQDKKAKDAARLSKKKRLRKWRKDTFGSEFEKSGPTYGFEKFVEEDAGGYGLGEGEKVLEVEEAGDGNIVEGVRKKKKRSKGKKKGGEEIES